MKAPLATQTRRKKDKGLAYSDTIALELAEVSHISYQNADSVVQPMHDRGFDQFFYFERDDTEAFLVGNAEKLIVIFRGTEPQSVKDWITNSQVAKVKACNGRVHAGFWNGCQDIWSEVETEIQRVRRQFAAPPPLFLTGHSLGGALAILAAAQLEMCGHQVDGVYTFGCPRIGDRHFAMQYNRKLYNQTFRLVNHRDIVAQLPPNELGYTHVGQLIYFDETGIRRISPFPQDNRFGWAEAFYDHDLKAYRQSLNATQAALLQESSIHA
ncbi:lipase family protein [filamentous cyanobacterium LEGE 11480]|uniref:Lipase family protein n=1 Tax=Romeriopsis navalis LEGE 11480 TaxID=2777977 RepID=A0A928Z3E6_9CYAN|nr:lipase family protein [Romeriopsis navalis]MBE9029118.1 lipase family protein [Romeriopsis navalis LEGE 11480]